MSSNRSRDWTLDAACRGADPDLFLPRESITGHELPPPIDEALAYCCRCPVAAECEAEADAETEFPMVGVWGGRYRTHKLADRHRRAVKAQHEAERARWQQKHAMAARSDS